MSVGPGCSLIHPTLLPLCWETAPHFTGEETEARGEGVPKVTLVRRSTRSWTQDQHFPLACPTLGCGPPYTTLTPPPTSKKSGRLPGGGDVTAHPVFNDKELRYGKEQAIDAWGVHR